MAKSERLEDVCTGEAISCLSPRGTALGGARVDVRIVYPGRTNADEYFVAAGYRHWNIVAIFQSFESTMPLGSVSQVLNWRRGRSSFDCYWT